MILFQLCFLSSTPFVRYSHMTVQETLTVVDKSGELIESLLSKLISAMDKRGNLTKYQPHPSAIV